MTPKAGSQLENVLARGVIEIIPKGSLDEALRSGKKLRLKLGLDPSKPDLHIGQQLVKLASPLGALIASAFK